MKDFCWSAGRKSVLLTKDIRQTQKMAQPCAAEPAISTKLRVSFCLEASAALLAPTTCKFVLSVALALALAPAPALVPPPHLCLN